MRVMKSDLFIHQSRIDKTGKTLIENVTYTYTISTSFYTTYTYTILNTPDTDPLLRHTHIISMYNGGLLYIIIMYIGASYVCMYVYKCTYPYECKCPQIDISLDNYCISHFSSGNASYAVTLYLTVS